MAVSKSVSKPVTKPVVSSKRSMSEVQFEIQQLRMDKVIYAVESCAISLVAIFGYFFLSVMAGFFSQRYTNLLNILLGINVGLAVICVGFLLFMGMGNMKRLNKIRALERELS